MTLLILFCYTLTFKYLKEYYILENISKKGIEGTAIIKSKNGIQGIKAKISVKFNNKIWDLKIDREYYEQVNLNDTINVKYLPQHVNNIILSQDNSLLKHSMGASIIIVIVTALLTLCYLPSAFLIIIIILSNKGEKDLYRKLLTRVLFTEWLVVLAL